MFSEDSSQKKQSPENGISGAKEMMRAIRTMVKREKILIGFLILLVALGEIGLRYMRPDLAGQVYSATMTGGHPVILSDKAYRLAENADFPPSETTILGLGDSTTFGTGVGAAETWPLQLQKMLKEPHTVYNAGIPGGEPQQMSYGFRELWTTPKVPEVAVLLVTSNMISFSNFRRTQEIEDPRGRKARLEKHTRHPKGLKHKLTESVQSSALWKAISINVDYLKFAFGLTNHRVNRTRPLSPLMPYGWVQPDVPEQQYSQMWDDFENGIATLKNEAELKNVCLAIGFLPPRFMLSNMKFDNLKFVPKNRLTMDAEQKVQAIVERLDLPYIPTASALRTARATLGPFEAPLYIPGDYTHLNAQGHTIIAAAISDFIAPIIGGTRGCTTSLKRM